MKVILVLYFQLDNKRNRKYSDMKIHKRVGSFIKTRLNMIISRYWNYFIVTISITMKSRLINYIQRFFLVMINTILIRNSNLEKIIK